jgi:methylphosphotriester-DNA--protein-cysteine methyltransferase
MNDNARWAAVVSRDASADGTFVYCVKTTKIFCRPNCKARLARRANVEFFDTTAEAQAAGYRSCKRCQPLLASYNPEADKVKKACAMIQTLPVDAPLPGLDRLAKEAGLTKHHFHRLFKRETGLTPREYAIASRRESLSEHTDSLASMTPLTPFTPFTANTNSTGTPLIVDDDAMAFTDTDQFTPDLMKQVSEEFNMFVIYYHIIETTFGLLLVAFQNIQICKIELGTSESELLESLELAFPPLYHLHSPIELASEEEAASFQQQINAVVEALEQPSGKVLDIPVAASLQDQGEMIT